MFFISMLTYYIVLLLNKVQTMLNKIINKPPTKTIAEDNNMIADSSEVRTQLLEQVNDGRLTLQQAQKQLKRIQKTAHEKGLYTRDDIISKRWIDFETAKAKVIHKNMKKLDKKLKNKDNIPAKKNKI